MVSTSDSAHTIWEAVLGRLELSIAKPSFETWLRPTQGLELLAHSFVVGVPTTFAAEYLEDRLYPLIDQALSAILGRSLEINFHVHQPHARYDPGDTLGPTEISRTDAGAPPNPRAPFPLGSPINRNHTFGSFIVGSSSQLAHAAAVSVSEAPGSRFNPLFIYSPPGLGKTHLLHAIAHHARQLGKSALYTSSEDFTNGFIDAIRNRKTDEFRRIHRSVDILLVDDIQFIAGKDQTQEGFFHTFNALHNANKQVVIACDRPPSGLALLQERLVSRFEWGLVADIQAPEVETRTAILRHLASSEPVNIGDEVLTSIAELSPTNVRQLQGNLTRVVAIAQFTNVSISQELVSQALSGTREAPATPHNPPSSTVLAAVAAFYGITVEKLSGASREKPLPQIRQFLAYLLYHHCHLSTVEISKLLGGKDRTTILYSLNKSQKLIASSSSYSEEFQSLKAHVFTGKPLSD